MNSSLHLNYACTSIYVYADLIYGLLNHIDNLSGRKTECQACLERYLNGFWLQYISFPRIFFLSSCGELFRKNVEVSKRLFPMLPVLLQNLVYFINIVTANIDQR